MKMAEEAVKKLGATAQIALNAADISLDAANKEVISVEGEAGVLGGILRLSERKGGQK